MSCGVGRKCGSDLVLLWLWCRLAATVLIRPLARELPYASGTALEKTERQKKKKKGSHPQMPSHPSGALGCIVQATGINSPTDEFTMNSPKQHP